MHQLSNGQVIHEHVLHESSISVYMSRPVLTTDDGVIDVCFSFHFRTADNDFSNHMVLALSDLHVCQLQNEVEY